MASRTLKAVPIRTGTPPTVNTASIPKGVKTNLAQAAFEAIQRDFQRTEVQEDYLRWKTERAARGA